MIRVRCLLSVLLSIAFAQFGVLATAPAHAHEAEIAHVVHAADVGDHGLVIITGAHHDDDHDHQRTSDHVLDFSAPPADGEPSKSHDDHVTHVHSCPQFAPVAAHEIAAMAKLVTQAVRPPQADAAPSRTSAPPLRPPRTSL